MKIKEEIVEKKIGIAPDYQYRALRDASWIKRNWHKNKFDIINMICHFTKNDSVLDLGTGSGNFELLFASSVKHIDGVDYNDEALIFLKKELAKRKIRNVQLTCADMRKIPEELGKNKYDLILSIDTIEHISKKDGGRLIAWSEKRLNKKGRLVIITPNYRSIWTLLEPILDIFSFTPNMGNHQHLSNYSLKTLTNALVSSGFLIKSATSFNLFSFLFPGKLNSNLLRFESKFITGLGCLLAVEAQKK